MTDKLEVLPGKNVLDWSAKGFNPSLEYAVEIHYKWTHLVLEGDPGSSTVSKKVEERDLPKAVLAKSDFKFFQFQQKPPHKYGDAEGKLNVELPDDIRDGTVEFALTFIASRKDGKEMKRATFPAPAWTVVDNVVKLEVHGKSLPKPRDPKKPEAIYGAPFEIAWSVKPVRALKSITLLGLPTGPRALGGNGPFPADTETKGVETVTLDGKAEQELKLELDLRDTVSPEIVDPFRPSFPMIVRPLGWRDLPERKNAKATQASGKHPEFGYKSNAAPAFAGDGEAIVQRLKEKRALIDPRPIQLQSGTFGTGNVYFRDGANKIDKDTAPFAEESRAEGTVPSTLMATKEQQDLFAFFRKFFFNAEGLPTTISALVVDGHFTIGTGFASSGGLMQKLLFTVLEADPALKASADAIGLAVDPAGKNFEVVVADVTTVDASGKAEPASLRGADALLYLSCNLELFSFVTNIGIGAQEDLRDGAGKMDAAARKAQRVMWVNKQWEMANDGALKDRPGSLTEAALFLVLHARHAGHFPTGWMGDGAANDVVSVADKVWEHLKGESLSLNGRHAVATSVCQAIPAAQARIESLFKAEKAAS